MAPDFFEAYLDSSIDEELASASRLGLTAIRLFLHNLAYDADPSLFMKNLERFLTKTERAGLGVGFVFFDDCWNHSGASTTSQVNNLTSF